MSFLAVYAIALTVFALIFLAKHIVNHLNLVNARKAIERNYLLFCLRDLIDRSEENTGNEPSISAYYRALDEAKSLIRRIEE